jgi:hypothetical protein
MADYEQLHAGISALRQKQVFFIGGSPKSGTTWLRLLLNAHPAVSCSGEGHFIDRLAGYLKNAVDQHCQLIDSDNKRLFNEVESYPRLDNADTQYMLASCIALFLIKQSQHKPARAIGEKTPGNIRFFGHLGALFPTAKFIQIVRDGRDCTVSAWFHNLRDPEWIKYNLGSMEAFAKRVAEVWAGDLASAQQFADRQPHRILRIRYEDLAAAPEMILARLFEFLGVEHDEKVVAQSLSDASFAKFSGGRNPGEENRLSFFRKGVAGDWRNHFSEDALQAFREAAGPWLERLGYERPAPGQAAAPLRAAGR